MIFETIFSGVALFVWLLKNKVPLKGQVLVFVHMFIIWVVGLIGVTCERIAKGGEKRSITMLVVPISVVHLRE